MDTSALIFMIFVNVGVTATTAYFFWKILTNPPDQDE